jgi:surface protein
MKCWGAGRLGDGSTTPSKTPVEVIGLYPPPPPPPSPPPSPSFSDGAELRTAVINCLAVDATGVACCASADCGPAGSTEMSGWDVGSVTGMGNLFDGSREFNANISAWDTSSVTTMQMMFRDAWVFNMDISDWNVSSVQDTREMFNNAYAFNANISA